MTARAAVDTTRVVLAYLREPTGWRLLLPLLALVLKMLVPPGYMPGTSLAQPIVLCADQGAMPAMPDTAMADMAMGDQAHHGHDAPGKAPPQDGDRTCAFAGFGATPLDTPPALPADILPPTPQPGVVAASLVLIAPGRGMAAPPPPSHAPPAPLA